MYICTPLLRPFVLWDRDGFELNPIFGQHLLAVVLPAVVVHTIQLKTAALGALKSAAAWAHGRTLRLAPRRQLRPPPPVPGWVSAREAHLPASRTTAKSNKGGGWSTPILGRSRQIPYRPRGHMSSFFAVYLLQSLKRTQSGSASNKTYIGCARDVLQ